MARQRWWSSWWYVCKFIDYKKKQDGCKCVCVSIFSSLFSPPPPSVQPLLSCTSFGFLIYMHYICTRLHITICTCVMSLPSFDCYKYNKRWSFFSLYPLSCLFYIEFARAATLLPHSAAPSEVGFQFLAAIRLIADSTPPLWKTHTRRLDFLTFSHHL